MDSKYILETGAMDLEDALDMTGKKNSRERYLLGCSLD